MTAFTPTFQPPIFLPPNKIQWNGVEKEVSAFGSVETSFSKHQLVEIAHALGIENAHNWTRRQLAKTILCHMQTKFSTTTTAATTCIFDANIWVPPLHFQMWLHDKKIPIQSDNSTSWAKERNLVIVGKEEGLRTYEEAFRRLDFFVDLYYWMHGVAMGVLPSPIRDFGRKVHAPDDSLRKELTDSLVAITLSTTQFVVTAVKTVKLNFVCDMNPELLVDKSFVCGLMLEKDAKSFQEKMNAKNFVCWTSHTDLLPHKDIKGTVCDTTLPDMVNPFFKHPNTSKELQDAIKYITRCVMVCDPVNLRPAEERLLPTIVCVLNGNRCGEEEP